MHSVIDDCSRVVYSEIHDDEKANLTERASDTPGLLSTTLVPPTAPRQAINGRLEHLRGIALGLRNLTHYTIRSLIHAGRLKDRLTTTT